LQERYENVSYYYALWGKDFIRELYKHSLALEQEFVVLSEKIIILNKDIRFAILSMCTYVFYDPMW